MSKPTAASRPLTGYALTNHFRKLRLREVFSPLEAYLFFELVAICNDEGWLTEFSASNGVLQAALGCSEQGLINARQRLAKAGLIAFVSGNRRTPTSYRFAVQGSTEFSHQQPNGSTQDSTEFSHSGPSEANGSSEGSTQGSTEFSPYKEQTKTKLLLPGGEGESATVLDFPASAKETVSDSQPIPPASPPPAPDPGPTFDEFWQAYGKKEDTKKCKLRWKALNPAQRRAALAAVPAYVAARPERKYRKNPLTWLNGECWQDEVPDYASQPTATAAPPAGHDAPPLSLELEPNPDFEAAQQKRLAAEAAERAQKFRATYATPAATAPLAAPTLTPVS